MTRLRTLHMARGSVPIASCYDSLYRGGITIKIKLTYQKRQKQEKDDNEEKDSKNNTKTAASKA